MPPKTPQSFSTVAKAAPHWAAMVIVVIACFVYLERKDARDADRGAMEHEKCHRVQQEIADVLKENTEAVREHSQTEAILSTRIEALINVVERRVILNFIPDDEQNLANTNRGSYHALPN